MTVEDWLRGQFQGIGTQIEASVLETAVLSAVFAKPVKFQTVNLTDEVNEHLEDTGFLNGLNYALSTLYYSMSAAITGGTKSEKRGNRQISIGGYPLTTKDREAFRALGDKLRGELGADIDENASDTGGMFDGRRLRNNPRCARTTVCVGQR